MGVGVGSILAERLLHGDVSARHVPLAAARWRLRRDRYVASAGARRGGAGEHSGVPALTGKLALLVDLVGVAMAGGLFTVPLYAICNTKASRRIARA